MSKEKENIFSCPDIITRTYGANIFRVCIRPRVMEDRERTLWINRKVTIGLFEELGIDRQSIYVDTWSGPSCLSSLDEEWWILLTNKFVLHQGHSYSILAQLNHDFFHETYELKNVLEHQEKGEFSVPNEIMLQEDFDAENYCQRHQKPAPEHVGNM